MHLTLICYEKSLNHENLNSHEDPVQETHTSHFRKPLMPKIYDLLV